MKVFAYIILLHKCLCFDLPREGCYSDLKINEDHYNVTGSYEMGDAYPMDAHYDGFGNLFYVEAGRNPNGFYYNVFMVRYNNSVPEKIPGLPEGQSYSIAVDTSDHNVNIYFGTGRGIYKYNYDGHGVSLVSETSLKLNMLLVDKDGNKYITESNDGIEELYLLDGEKKIKFNTLEALNEIAIDDKNNIYYIKEESLYVLKSTLSSPVYIGNIKYNNGIAQISFNEDYVFIASDTLAYFHVNEVLKMRIVEDAPGNLTAIAFDHKGCFILGVRGKIIKYKKNDCFFRD